MSQQRRYTWIPGIILAALVVIAPAAEAQLTLSKVFTPDTIGPGSVSTVTFTLTNGTGTLITGLQFTDVLPTAPGDVDVADPTIASTTCTDAILGAPPGGGTIDFSNARLGSGETCTVTVDVTAATPGVHTNPAILLEYNELDGDPPFSLPADLTVDSSLPGFSKSFAPSSVPLGDRSTLTFTIDNSANGSNVNELDFTDNLPLGMEIADPASAATTCGTTLIPPTLTATAGTSVITLDVDGIGSFPAVAAGATCTVTVDVTGTGAGMLDNISNELLASFVSAGKASATLDVTRTDLALRKSFADDPTPPGSAVTLDFTINNFDRDFSATGVAFTDDLTTLVPALAGLTFDSLLSNDCGGSVSGVGGTTIGLSGGTLGPEGSCTLSVSLTVPGSTTPGAYTNTTSTVTATVGGSPVVGNMASDILFVEPVPLVTKTFMGDPVNPGDTVVLEFTVTNTSPSSSATEIAFQDLFDPIMATAPVTPGDGCCGAGSTCTFTPLSNPPPPSSVIPATLSISGGTLAPAGMAGDSCTFSITLDVGTNTAPGIYFNTTSEITATVDGATRTGDPASDTLTVIAAPDLSKAFTDDPVAPGGTVTLEFTLSYPPDASGDATAIAFDDDLTFLAGLTATSLPLTEACDPDGPGGDPGTGTLSGTTMLSFSGGTLSPGESCTFSVILSVPTASSGNYTNTATNVEATVAGETATSADASDVLNVADLSFSKEFLGDPVIAGESLTLRFSIENLHPTDLATITFFTDNLGGTLPGLTATLPPSMDTCGGTLSGTTTLTYIGGSVASLSTCDIEVEVTVPAGAVDGTYTNTTSSLLTSLGTIDPATNELTVDSNLLSLTKAFTDDPVAPGDSVTLEFTLTNLDAGNAASGIGFSDDLGAALAGLTFDSVLFDDCGGTVSGTGTDMIDVSGISLAAAASCTIRVSLTVPSGTVAGIYTNTTSGVTGTIGGFAVSGDAASDDLEIIQLLDFSKSFDGPTTATGMATLTFTITNPGTDTATSIAFSDDLDAVISGLIATSLPAVPCGAGSAITGIGFLTFSGGELPPAGGMCSFDVDVLVPATATAGTFPNITSDLFRSGLPVADPATADLIIEPPPTFAKVFMPDAISAGGLSTLEFTIDNSAISMAASALDFTDNLPTGVVVAAPSVTSNTCDGTLTATAGTGVITLTGGTVGAGASCTVSVDVTSDTVGTHVNTTGDLTSSSGNSGTASDSLDVSAPTCFTSPTATGTGNATICFTGGDPTGCGFTQIDYIPLEGDPLSPPTGSAPTGLFFPHGLVSFTVGEFCTLGFTAQFTWTLPSALPPGTQYWKYGPTSDNLTPHWYVLPATIASNTISFSITDGGLGDHDLTADGTIIDPSGPGVAAIVPVPGGVQEIPTLTKEFLVLFSALLALAVLVATRQRLR